MTKRLYFVLWLGVIFTHTLISEELVIVADPWLPFNGGIDDPHPGYLIEIAKAVFEPAGTKVVYKNVNWARAVEDARQGKVDAIAGAFVSDAPDFVFPKEPLGIVENHFYVKKESPWRYQGISSLEKISLGVINGYSYGSLDDYVSKNKNNFERIQMVSGENALEQNIKKLMAGRIDAVVEVKSVFQYLIKNRPEAAALVDAGGLPRIEVFIAFSPSHPQSKKRAEFLSQGVQSLRKNGRLKTILESYDLKDWK